MLGSEAEYDIVYQALRVPALQRQAIWALGHVGTARAIEYCIAGMRRDELSRAAGEAYCWITGADLVRDRLSAPEPAAEVPAFEDDDLDANLVPSPEDLWPLPDPDAVQRHWQGTRSAFAPNVRYLAGSPVSVDTLVRAVESGPMRRRPDLIVDLGARTKGAYDVEPRAFVVRQRQMMASARGALSAASGR
jgi:uncharacterized protein (TIGR02270 family)